MVMGVDKGSEVCHTICMIKGDTMKFNSNGVYATSPFLEQIANECIQRERAMREAMLRDIEEQCVSNYAVYNISDRH